MSCLAQFLISYLELSCLSCFFLVFFVSLVWKRDGAALICSEIFNPFIWIMNWYINIIPSTFVVSYFCPVVYNLSPCHKLSIAFLSLSWFVYLEGDIKEVDKQRLCFPETLSNTLASLVWHLTICSLFFLYHVCFGYKFRYSFDWVRFKNPRIF